MRCCCSSLGSWLPTLAEIESAPELAILSALHASLKVAAFAVGAANPELADPDLRLSLHDPTADLVDRASRILSDLDLLARSIHAYRVANSIRVASHRRPGSDDDC